MQKVVLLSIIVLITTGYTHSQKSEPFEYFDKDWLFCEKDTATYYRKPKYDANGLLYGNITDYYKDGTMQMKATFKHGKKEGFCIYYHTNGNARSECNYKDDKKLGLEKLYYPNGLVYKELLHFPDHFYIQSVYDTAGKQTVVKGNGKYIRYYLTGEILETGYVKNGMLVGQLIGYTEKGDTLMVESYKEGKLLLGKHTHRASGKTYFYKERETYNVDNFEKLSSYIQNAHLIDRPVSLRRVYIYVRFDATGAITRVKLLTPEQGDFEKKLASVIIAYDGYRVATKLGMPVPYGFIMPVSVIER